MHILNRARWLVFRDRIWILEWLVFWDKVSSWNRAKPLIIFSNLFSTDWSHAELAAPWSTTFGVCRLTLTAWCMEFVGCHPCACTPSFVGCHPCAWTLEFRRGPPTRLVHIVMSGSQWLHPTDIPLQHALSPITLRATYAFTVYFICNVYSLCCSADFLFLHSLSSLNCV